MSSTIKIITTDPGKPSITNESDTKVPYIRGKPNERSSFFYFLAWIVFILTLINSGLFLKGLVESDIPTDAIVSQIIFSVAVLILCTHTIKNNGNVNPLFKIALLLIFLMILLFIGYIVLGLIIFGQLFFGKHSSTPWRKSLSTSLVTATI